MIKNTFIEEVREISRIKQEEIITKLIPIIKTSIKGSSIIGRNYVDLHYNYDQIILNKIAQKFKDEGFGCSVHLNLISITW